MDWTNYGFAGQGVVNNEPGPNGETNGRWVMNSNNSRVWVSNPQATTAGNPSTSLSNILSGAGAPVVPVNLQKPALNLQGYTGDTSVGMSDQTNRLLNLISNYTESGTLADLLSGKTNQGLFESGVVAPALREFRNVTLPGINEEYSGGAYGGNYWGGARLKAGDEAKNKLNENISKLRYQDYNAAQDRSVQAAQLLPQLAQASYLREQIATLDKNREIENWYKTQGLSLDQYNADMSFLSAALTQRGQDIGQASDIRGNAISAADIDLRRYLGDLQSSTSRYGADVSAAAQLNSTSMTTAASRANAEAAARAEILKAAMGGR